MCLRETRKFKIKFRGNMDIKVINTQVTFRSQFKIFTCRYIYAVVNNQYCYLGKICFQFEMFNGIFRIFHSYHGDDDKTTYPCLLVHKPVLSNWQRQSKLGPSSKTFFLVRFVFFFFFFSPRYWKFER